MQKLASVLVGPPEVAQEGLQEACQGAAHRLSGLGEAFRARLGAFLALPEPVAAAAWGQRLSLGQILMEIHGGTGGLVNNGSSSPW